MDEGQKNLSLEESTLWLIDVMHWFVLPYGFDQDHSKDAHEVVNLRLRFFMNALESRPELKEKVFDQMIVTIQGLLDFSFLTEIGLDERSGFIQEFQERIAQKLVPPAVVRKDLKSFVQIAFDDMDERLLTQTDSTYIAHFLEVFSKSKYFETPLWKKQLKESVFFLMVQVQADAFSEVFRERLGVRRIDDSSYFKLNDISAMLMSQDRPLTTEEITRADFYIQACRNDLAKVIQGFDQSGMSQTLILQVERIRIQLIRIQKLIYLLTEDFQNQSWQGKSIFVMQLIEDIHGSVRRRYGFLNFLSDNLRLTIQKIIRVNIQIGDHYIARTKEQLREIFSSACGGGAITVITIYLKLLITYVGFTGFFGGLMHSLNYALSFLLIQLLHFTLATKQPASTAAVIAEELDGPKDKLNETLRLMIKTQVTSVIGNLFAVIPLAYVLSYGLQQFFHFSVVNSAKAYSILESTNIFGPTILFAILTGCLLFSASLFGGWFTNWVTYRKIPEHLRGNARLRKWLKPQGAEKLAQFVHENSAAIAGNFSLGFLLGMTPEILAFFSIPLEVRHVTLASGSLATAVATLDAGVFATSLFWQAVVGILIVGVLNIFVSFALSLVVARRSK